MGLLVKKSVPDEEKIPEKTSLLAQKLAIRSEIRGAEVAGSNKILVELR